MMIGLALFTIFNTFLMNVGERRKQLAVLRAIGATRRQVIRMLLLEGLAMGLMGTVLGSLLGLAGAYGLTQGMGRIYSTAMPALRITPDAICAGRDHRTGGVVVGDVHSGLSRRPHLAAGRHEICRRRGPQATSPSLTSCSA